MGGGKTNKDEEKMNKNNSLHLFFIKVGKMWDYNSII